MWDANATDRLLSEIRVPPTDSKALLGASMKRNPECNAIDNGIKKNREVSSR